MQIDDYKTPIDPTWCPGCGDFGILMAMKKALVELEVNPHEAVFTFDIGCSGNMADKVNGYGFKSLHGRSIATASGVSIANPNLKIIATGGDGGLLEEGISHLMWAARSNYNLTAVMHNNQIFGLTTGQPTVTTERHQPGKTATSAGVIEQTLNPIQIALVSKASFVARGYSGDLQYLTEIIKAGINHNGFAFIDALQPCVTYNKHNTFKWFGERIYKLKEEKKYDPTDWDLAFKTGSEWEEKIATGILYQGKEAVPYNKQLPQRKDKKTRIVDEVKKPSISKFIAEFE